LRTLASYTNGNLDQTQISLTNMIDMRKWFTLTVVLAVVSTSIAQKRYLDEVFTDVVSLKDQIYSVNITVQTGIPAPDTLKYDLYMPDGDTCGARPLAVVLHTGTFLPRGLFSTTGDKDDY